MKKKVLFISSTGGHLNELLQLKPLFDKYDYYIITEKDKANEKLKEEYKKRLYFRRFKNPDCLSRTQTRQRIFLYSRRQIRRNFHRCLPCAAGCKTNVCICRCKRK